MRVLLLLALSLAACREQKVVATRDPAPDVTPPPLPPPRGILRHACNPFGGEAYEISIGEGVTCESKPSTRLDVYVVRGPPSDAGTTRWVFGTNVDNGHATSFVGGKPAGGELIGSVILTMGNAITTEIDLGDGARRIRENVTLHMCPGGPHCE